MMGLSGGLSAGQREVPAAGPSTEQRSGLADGGTAPGASLDAETTRVAACTQQSQRAPAEGARSSPAPREPWLLNWSLPLFLTFIFIFIFLAASQGFQNLSSPNQGLNSGRGGS